MNINNAIQAIVIYIFSFGANATDLHIAAASNFAYPAKRLAEAFTRQHDNIDVKISTASSGKLYAHIRYGAPFDIFMSADFEKPLALVESNLADESSAFVYATGKLALWVPGQQDFTLDILASVETIAIANPKHAPYGAAGEEVLKASNFDLLSNHRNVVIGENIAQTYQYVQTSHANAGMVALSQLMFDQVDPREYLVIPESDYSAIQQVAIITRIGLENPISQQWMSFLKSDTAVQIIENLGYSAALHHPSAN